MTTEQCWRKSTYSGTQEACVEVAVTDRSTGIRDSKQPSGPSLTFSGRAFTAFTTLMRAV